MRHGSLFSGIGGFDLAAEWMGWENVFHCEWNEFGKKVLKYYWPNAESFHDITKTDFTKYAGTIDIISGGFPCQPYSTAGKRLGKDDERHLWPEMLRAIQEIKPRWVVGENVRGLLNWNEGLVFHEVQIDLENAGYEVQPFLLPAASVNAPHRRDRVWFVAYSRDCGNTRTSREIQKETITENSRREKQSSSSEQQIQLSDESNSLFGNVANSCDKRLQRGEIKGSVKEKKREGEYDRNSSKQVSIGWENFPTQAPICDGDDGLSNRLDSITFSKWRSESIKAGGNAVVPQLVHQIFKAIEEYERTVSSS